MRVGNCTENTGVKGRKVRIIICVMPMLVVRVMKSMTYAIRNVRVIAIMLNRPRFAIAKLVSDPPSMQGVGGGGGVAPHAPKKNYFFAVFLACLKALLVGAPFEPGFRIRSAGFPAAFCALILRLLAAIFE